MCVFVCVCVCVCYPNLGVMFIGPRIWFSNLFIYGFPHSPTSCCFKRNLNNPIFVIPMISSPALTLPLILFLPSSPFVSLSPFQPPPLPDLISLIQSLLNRIQIITLSLIPMQSHLYLESLETIISSENSLEIYSRHQIVFDSKLSKGIISTRRLI